MADEHLPHLPRTQIEPLRSPWREQLIEALSHVQHNLLLVGPYIKANVIAMLKDVLAERLTSQPLAVRIITRVIPDDFLSGASDIAALQQLLAWPADLPGSSVELRAVSNLHAKVWVFDSALAQVGSGNATFSGLESNLEYGLAVSDPSLVERILQDWQEWWELATPVHASELEQMRLWLDALASDTDMRQANNVAQEKRQAAERRIGAAPRIGGRLVVARSTRRGSKAFSEQIPSYAAASHSQDELITPNAQETSHPLPEVIHVSAAQLWQALCWTIPQFSSPETQSSVLSGTYVKITTRQASGGQQVLQSTWADGKRFSQADIQGHARDALAHPSWTVTLGIGVAQQLANFVQQVHGQSAIDNQAFSEHDLYLWWQSSPSRLAIVQAQEGSIPITFPCMPVTTPGNVSMLHPPLSQLIIEQGALMARLMSLKQQWELLHPGAAAPTTIELSFDSSGTVFTLLLSVGPIDAPLIVSLPATDNILGDSELRLRLDFAAFQHIVTSTQRVRRWRILIGRDADAARFMPEFDDERARAEPGSWLHELRDVAGG